MQSCSGNGAQPLPAEYVELKEFSVSSKSSNTEILINEYFLWTTIDTSAIEDKYDDITTITLRIYADRYERNEKYYVLIKEAVITRSEIPPLMKALPDNWFTTKKMFTEERGTLYVPLTSGFRLEGNTADYLLDVVIQLNSGKRLILVTCLEASLGASRFND